PPAVPPSAHPSSRAPSRPRLVVVLCFFHGPASPELYTLSLHDALPISQLTRSDIAWSCLAESSPLMAVNAWPPISKLTTMASPRSEEHTSELQSRENLVCRLLLEKKKRTTTS